MDGDILFFFQQDPAVLPLYETLEARMQAELGPVQFKVQKTQISFYKKHLFGCVSFLRVKKKKELPEHSLTLTFGLGHPADSPRIAVITEPYPRRWTHHLILSRPEQIDGELMGWLKEAAEYAVRK